MKIDASLSDHDAEAAVVLVDGAGGSELAILRDCLTQFFGTPAVLLGALGDEPLALDPAAGTLSIGDRRVRPVVVWTRHTSAAALAAGPMARVLDAVAWAGLLERLVDCAHTAIPGSAPAGPGQLADAARLGVRVPRTIISTDAPAAARRLGSSRVVVKTQDFRLYETDRARWPAVLPRIIGPEQVTAGDGGRPLIVQEYVVHDRELRVFYLDGGVCAFEIGKSAPSSMWTDPDSVVVSKVDCPAAARSAVLTLCAGWRLRYGAFDLLLSAAGEVVFLEVNPDGDWLWFERKARWHGVSFMAAVMVRELFIRGTSWGAHADDCDAD